MQIPENGKVIQQEIPTILVGEVRFFDYKISVTDEGKVFLIFTPYGMPWASFVFPFDRLGFRQFVSASERIFDRDETDVPPAV